MKRTTIVRIAEWTGWCGPCADERPLVLTRTGRHSLRSWLSGSDAGERPLTLTCRLCGVGVVVPSEADDPEVVVAEAPVAEIHETVPTVLDRTTGTLTAGQPLVGDPVLEPAASTPTAALTPGLIPALIPASTPALAPPQAAVPVPAPAVAPVTSTPTAPLTSASEAEAALHATRQGMASVLGQLVQQREAAAVRAPVLPQQRAAEAPTPVDGLQALQLLAEGLDLLSAQR